MSHLPVKWIKLNESCVFYKPIFSLTTLKTCLQQAALQHSKSRLKVTWNSFYLSVPQMSGYGSWQKRRTNCWLRSGSWRIIWRKRGRSTPRWTAPTRMGSGWRTVQTCTSSRCRVSWPCVRAGRPLSPRVVNLVCFLSAGDANRQISEYKFKLSKAEQEIGTMEQNVSCQRLITWYSYIQGQVCHLEVLQNTQPHQVVTV